MRRLWLIGLLAGTVACAPKVRPAAPADLTGLDRADALVLDGCEACLREAQEIYRRIGAGAGRPIVITRLFETALLLTLRQKELAIDTTAAFLEAVAPGAMRAASWNWRAPTRPRQGLAARRPCAHAGRRHRARSGRPDARAARIC